MEHVVFLGPPGSGKGTQAARLAEATGMIHLSTGDLLRSEVKRASALGKQVEHYLASGTLVPDTLLIAVMEAQLPPGGNNGVIFDGFPRTIPQAESLNDMLQRRGRPLTHAILLEVPDDEIVRRLSSRWYCPTCQKTFHFPDGPGDFLCDGQKPARRPDDEESVVLRRLEVYRTHTAPIIDFYKKHALLRRVKADQPADTVHNLLREMVGVTN